MDRVDAVPEGILRLRVVYRLQQPSYTLCHLVVLWYHNRFRPVGRVLPGEFPGDARVLVFLRRMTYESRFGHDGGGRDSCPGRLRMG